MGDFSTVELFYLLCAVIGGVLFVLRAVLFFIGLGGHGDADGSFAEADMHGDFDLSDVPHDVDTGGVHLDLDTGFHDDMAVDHGETDVSFKVLSLQGVTAFFTMFGLVGLSLARGGSSAFIHVISALVAGVFTMWVIAMLFRFMVRLQSEGTLQMTNALGQEGTVYLTIPKGGTGKVNLVVQGSLRVFEAVTEDKKEISTGTNVRVVRVINNNLLVVERI